MSTNASKRRPLYIVMRLLILVVLTYLVWYVAVPRVEIDFSKEGTGDLRFVLNTQNEIFRGNLAPGESTGGPGHLFADDDFFMEFDWRNAGQNHCIRITPKWPTTKIHIGSNGEVDRSAGSGTDVDQLEPCAP
ncbi:hypothetical protein [Pseudomonas gozinkensis]|uniref:hypothetical protein n=1 Tax=Pseudomonas gozinkensis TaxID=2774461 RepID=UPI001FC7FDD4|nr:hypothetical protein [Pseudomonas gozinkensis]